MKPQSWLSSWYIDLTAFHIIPLISSAFFLIFFNLGYKVKDETFFIMIAWLGVVDWAHFASLWPRIFSNPVETSLDKKKYVSFFFLIVLAYIILCLFVSERSFILVLIAYMAIFHVIRQQYGFVRIYSRTDARKTKVEDYFERSLVYLGMITPLIFWHFHNTNPEGVWFRELFKHEFFLTAFYVSVCLLSVALTGYIYFEVKRTRQNNYFNIAKNLTIFSTLVGWGIVSFLPQNSLVLAFTVQLHHNLSYVALVWIIGNRDLRLSQKKGGWSFYTMRGLFIYMIGIAILGQVIFTLYIELNSQTSSHNVLFGSLLNFIPKGEGAFEDLGRGLFFATQIHHFIVDRYLWRKEKDFAYVLASRGKS